MLDDLGRRLAATRFSAPVPGEPWAAGTPPTYLSELVAHWRDRFDWPATLARLNGYPHVRGELGEVVLHAVHRPALTGPEAPAVLLLHGWPYTFAELLPLADELPDFHVVVPSLPGFGYSIASARYRCDRDSMAATMHALMGRLGHERYFAYGEDVGAPVSDSLAAHHPGSVLGIHATHAAFPSVPADQLTAPERAFFAWLERQWDGEDGYARLQTRKPDTLAAGLVDSPAGLAAWLVEKFRAWSDCDGDVERRFSKDALLTTVMLYWSTASIGTSFRCYAEGAEPPLPVIEVPASVAVQRHEREYPRELAERAYADLRSFRHMPSGGHFAAAEEPAAVAADLRALARSTGALPA